MFSAKKHVDSQEGATAHAEADDAESKLIQELAAQKEKEAIEAERALTSTPVPHDIPVPSPQNSNAIPLPDQPAPKRSPGSGRDGAFIGPMQPGGASSIPLPPTEKFQHIGPNDPLVFKVCKKTNIFITVCFWYK